MQLLLYTAALVSYSLARGDRDKKKDIYIPQIVDSFFISRYCSNHHHHQQHYLTDEYLQNVGEYFSPLLYHQREFLYTRDDLWNPLNKVWIFIFLLLTCRLFRQSYYLNYALFTSSYSSFNTFWQYCIFLTVLPHNMSQKLFLVSFSCDHFL